MKHGFILQDRDQGKFVALDKASGGYPYLTGDPFEAKLWETLESAEEYNIMFKGAYIIYGVEIDIELSEV